MMTGGATGTGGTTTPEVEDNLPISGTTDRNDDTTDGGNLIMSMEPSAAKGGGGRVGAIAGGVVGVGVVVGLMVAMVVVCVVVAVRKRKTYWKLDNGISYPNAVYGSGNFHGIHCAWIL